MATPLPTWASLVPLEQNATGLLGSSDFNTEMVTNADWLNNFLANRGATSLMTNTPQPIPTSVNNAFKLFQGSAPINTGLFPDISGGGMPDNFDNTEPLNSITPPSEFDETVTSPPESYSLAKGAMSINNPSVQGNLLGKGLGLATGLSMLGPLGGLFGGAIGAYQDTEVGNQAFSEATGHVGTQSFWSNLFNTLTFGLFGSDVDEQLQEDYDSIIGFDNPFGLDDAQQVEGPQDQPFSMNDLGLMQTEAKIANALATWPTDLPSIGGPTASPPSSVTGVGFGQSVGDSLATGEGFGQPTDDTSGDADAAAGEPDADDPF
tara:strand:- start:448 stop:1407 length:960 start_codon:yes stop_codon:yes gene_type:complete